MKKNVGFADRLIRTVAALVLGSFYIIKGVTGTAGILLLVLTGLLLLTGLAGFCPLYSALGISTGKKTTIRQQDNKGKD
jgi:hypothetical protein